MKCIIFLRKKSFQFSADDNHFSVHTMLKQYDCCNSLSIKMCSKGFSFRQPIHIFSNIFEKAIFLRSSIFVHIYNMKVHHLSILSVLLSVPCHSLDLIWSAQGIYSSCYNSSLLTSKIICFGKSQRFHTDFFLLHLKW